MKQFAREVVLQARAQEAAEMIKNEQEWKTRYFYREASKRQTLEKIANNVIPCIILLVVLGSVELFRIFDTWTHDNTCEEFCKIGLSLFTVMYLLVIIAASTSIVWIFKNRIIKR